MSVQENSAPPNVSAAPRPTARPRGRRGAISRRAGAALTAAACATAVGGRAARGGTPAYFTNADAANSPYALDDGANWSPAGVPTGSNDVVIDNSDANLTTGATLTFNSSTAAAQALGSLNINTSSAIDIYNLASNASGASAGTNPNLTVTLGQPSSTNAYASPLDLISVAAGSSLTFNSSSTSTTYGTLTIALAQSGNFDVAGTATANLSAPVTGAFALTKTGAGTLTISNAQSFTGGLTIAAGTVAVASTTYLGPTTTVTTIANGAVLSFTNTATITGATTKTFVLSGGGEIDAAVSTALDGVISGTGGLVKGGPGILTLSPETSGTTTLTSNTYTGGTTVTAGTLQFNTQNALPAGLVTMGAGTTLWDVNTATSGNFPTTVTFSLGGAVTFNEPLATKTFIYNGSISGNGGSLLKTGAGTIYLQGSNSYSGGTTINGGTVRAEGVLGLGGMQTGTGPVTINSGGVLGGNGSVGAVVVNSGGNISGGSSGSAPATLTTAAETWNAGGGYLAHFNLASGTTSTLGLNDKLSMTSLSVAGGPFTVTLLAVNASTGTVSLPAGGTLVIADDLDRTAANPFNTSGGSTFASLAALQAALTLVPGTGIVSATGNPLQLDTTPDGTGGYDLIVDAAAPEPTSLLLLGLAAAPALLGRQLRGKRHG